MIAFDKLSTLVQPLRAEWESAEPFPHVVIDNFLLPEKADQVLKGFDATSDGWVFHSHYNERKYCHSNKDLMAPELQELLNDFESPRWLEFLGQVTGIPKLLADPSLDGSSGLNRSLTGCYLNIHRESFGHNRHENWQRQINLLLYLNRDWREEWRGDLELHDHRTRTCAKLVAPIFNRLLMFHTNEVAFHGHPKKLICPENVLRKSVVLYYFTDEGRKFPLKPVLYKSEQRDGRMRKLLISLDNLALRVYFPIRKYTPINDAKIEKVMRFLGIVKD